MTLEDFVLEFNKSCEESGASGLQLSGDTKFKELEVWGSMTAVLTIVMVEENFGKEITTDDLEACETLESLYNLIQAN